MPAIITLDDRHLPLELAPPILEPQTQATLEQMHRTVCDLQVLARNYRRSMVDLSRAHHETLVRLAQAAELKDGDTGVHIVRIGQIAARLGSEVGLDSDTCSLLCRAAPMHDIGKIGIPDAILQKPGTLDTAELALMRQHPLIGARLLGDSEVPLFQMAAAIALHHHEKWDGSGYPAGLRGEKIPVVARVVALADVFDALTMDRCYRTALSDKHALELICAASGSHFEPRVVRIFADRYADFTALRDAINRRFSEEPHPRLAAELFDPGRYAG